MPGVHGRGVVVHVDCGVIPVLVVVAVVVRHFFLSVLGEKAGLFKIIKKMWYIFVHQRLPQRQMGPLRKTVFAATLNG